jgi:hypothetical protein
VDSILSIENSILKIKKAFPDIEDTDKLRQFIYAFPDSYIDILTELHLYQRRNKVSDNILDYIISKKGNLYELKLIYDKFGHWIDDDTVSLIFINKLTIYQAVLFAKYKSYVDEIIQTHNNFDFSLLERFFENNNDSVIYYVKEILDIQPDFKFDYLDPKFAEFNAYLESITKVPQILDMFVTNK